MKIYYKIFWDPSYKIMHETTSKSFIAPSYQIIFGDDAPCMYKRAKETLIKVAYWFPIGEATFIRVLDPYRSPHDLPTLETNIVLLQEVCYQLTTWCSKKLVKGKKNLWPIFPLTIGAYTLEKFKEVDDPDLCRNTKKYINRHKHKDAVEIILHLINIKN